MMDDIANQDDARGISRRAMFAAGAGGALAAAMPSSVMAASVRRLDPNKVEDARQIVRKLRYRLDEGLLFWWIKGDYLADVDAELTPLYGMNFGSIQEVRQLPGGAFEILQMELGFRTDLVTGQRLTSMRNPLTGETIPVPFNPVGPSLVHYTADAIPQVNRNFGGSEIDFTPEPERPVVIQGTAYMEFRAHSRVRTPGFADRIVNDISTIYGPAEQALDPTVMSVDARLHSSDIATFPRWMNMGARHGTITLRGIGGKVMKIGDMPQDFLALLDAHDRSIIADPAAALRRPQAIYKG
ncbi:MAG: DUF1838 family protein [Sphingobium sp.]